MSRGWVWSIIIGSGRADGAWLVKMAGIKRVCFDGEKEGPAVERRVGNSKNKYGQVRAGHGPPRLDILYFLSLSPLSVDTSLLHVCYLTLQVNGKSHLAASLRRISYGVL